MFVVVPALGILARNARQASLLSVPLQDRPATVYMMSSTNGFHRKASKTDLRESQAKPTERATQVEVIANQQDEATARLLPGLKAQYLAPPLQIVANEHLSEFLGTISLNQADFHASQLPSEADFFSEPVSSCFSVSVANRATLYAYRRFGSSVVRRKLQWHWVDMCVDVLRYLPQGHRPPCGLLPQRGVIQTALELVKWAQCISTDETLHSLKLFRPAFPILYFSYASGDVSSSRDMAFASYLRKSGGEIVSPEETRQYLQILNARVEKRMRVLSAAALRNNQPLPDRATIRAEEAMRMSRGPNTRCPEHRPQTPPPDRPDVPAPRLARFPFRLPWHISQYLSERPSDLENAYGILRNEEEHFHQGIANNFFCLRAAARRNGEPELTHADLQDIIFRQAICTRERLRFVWNWVALTAEAMHEANRTTPRANMAASLRSCRTIANLHPDIVTEARYSTQEEEVIFRERIEEQRQRVEESKRETARLARIRYFEQNLLAQHMLQAEQEEAIRQIEAEAQRVHTREARLAYFSRLPSPIAANSHEVQTVAENTEPILSAQQAQLNARTAELRLAYFEGHRLDTNLAAAQSRFQEEEQEHRETAEAQRAQTAQRRMSYFETQRQVQQLRERLATSQNVGPSESLVDQIMHQIMQEQEPVEPNQSQARGGLLLNTVAALRGLCTIDTRWKKAVIVIGYLAFKVKTCL